MATKPDAARGKTTTKGTIKKFQKAVKNIIATQGMRSPKGSGMSPGAMGGRAKPKALTPEQSFKKRREILRTSPMAATEDMDLSKMRKRVDEIAKIMGTGVLGGAGRQLKKEFDDGGAVDMTTEVDVE